MNAPTVAEINYSIGERVCRRHKDLGTILAVCDKPNGYIVQMDNDEPGAVIMVAAYLLRDAPPPQVNLRALIAECEAAWIGGVL